MRSPTVLMFCLFAGLFFSSVGVADTLPQSGTSSRVACLSYEPSVVELSGTVVQKTFTDATDRPETEWLLNLPQPICVNEDSKEPDLNYAQKGVRAIQLVFLDHKLYAKYKSLLGKKVIATGTLFAGITAHHHTPVLLTVSALKIAG